MSETEPRLSLEDSDTLDALRRGDEDAFAALVHRHHSGLCRMARLHVASAQVAEEVVQETWIALLQSLDRFEGRASLKTWIFRIMLHQARARGEAERQSAPFSAFLSDDGVTSAHAPDRFLEQRDGGVPRWASMSQESEALPEENALWHEISMIIDKAIALLPPRQRELITLRDLGGRSAAETCAVMALSEANQRVLLHRARASIRAALGPYLHPEEV